MEKSIAEASVRYLNRQLFTLWHYLDEEGLWEDAQGYLEDHKDDQPPFEPIWEGINPPIKNGAASG